MTLCLFHSCRYNSSTATAKDASILMAFDQKVIVAAVATLNPNKPTNIHACLHHLPYCFHSPSYFCRNTILQAFNETFSATGDRTKMAEYQMRVKNSEHELSSVLYYPPALALFEAFSIKEIATESLFFWKAVDQFEDLCGRLERQKAKAASLATGSHAKSSSSSGDNQKRKSSVSGSTVHSGSSAASGPLKTQRFVKQTESGPAQAKRQLAVGISQLRDMCSTIMTEYVFQGSPQQVSE